LPGIAAIWPELPVHIKAAIIESAEDFKSVVLEKYKDFYKRPNLRRCSKLSIP
jgi:hypothetical protein